MERYAGWARDLPRNMEDSALQERIRINAESMTRVKAAAARLNDSLALVPTISSAFSSVDKEMHPFPPALLPSAMGRDSSNNSVNTWSADGQSRNPSIRVVYDTLRSTCPGIGIGFNGSIRVDGGNSNSNRIGSISPCRGPPSSASNTETAPENQKALAIQQSKSYNLISKPLPMPPRAMVKNGGLMHSYSSPAMFTQDGIVVFTENGLFDFPKMPFRPFSLGRVLTLEERVERLTKMRQEALAVVEAKEREDIDSTASDPVELEEENDAQQEQTNAESWI
ncbi:hypothetical protein QBC39DRAFT_382542 [Podospora conica]|nr:hypothetical protein QBC39DRAFT_382542 [Schizothecium conicum]